jgi:hypothetical protein
MNWKQYIEQAIKTGLESPTPYKVIPYKNGIGIKKIEFIKPKKTMKQMEQEQNNVLRNLGYLKSL